MNYKSELIDNVFFVYWLAPPQPEEVRAVFSEVERISQQQGGNKFIYVSAVAPTSKVPNAEQRKLVNELIEKCRAHCSVVHMIMKGSDLQHNLQRVIVQGLLILSRNLGDFMYIHKNTDTVAADISQRTGKDGADIMRRAIAANVV